MWYVDGENLYEYCGRRAAGAVDPSGEALVCVPCSQCQKTLDREEGQAIRQIEREAIHLGLPGSMSVWKVAGGALVSGGAVGLWGGVFGSVVGIIIGGVAAIGKLVELAELEKLLDAEIQSDIAAYNNCVKNCKN